MLPILHHDDHVVAIDKPPGLLVHRTGLDAGETRFAVQLLRDQIGRRVWPVHRLDKGTSGVLLFALHAEAARVLSAQFESDAPGLAPAKTYRAIVRGWPPEHGTIDHPLPRLADDGGVHRQALQPARTHHRLLRRLELPLPFGAHPTLRLAEVALQPETGRRHQIRRHMKHLSHPLVGDSTHGKGALNRLVAQHLGVQRLWLHAEHLALRHPATGAPLILQAPVGADWALWSSAAITGAPSPGS